MERDHSAKFSPSKLDTYKNCPRQYRFRYVDRIKVEGTSVEAFLGTCVHGAFEALYEGLQHGKRLTEDETVAVFDRAWAEGFGPLVRIRSEKYSADDWKALGRECVRGYYRVHAPFDEDKTVAVEKRLGFPLRIADAETGEEAEVRIEGFIDRLAIAADGVFEVHDYKTSGSLPTQADKDEDWQLAIYDIAVRLAWPQAPGVRLKWHFVRHGHTIVSTRSAEALEKLKADIAALVRTIWRDERFEPVKSALCDWCDYRDRCPLWMHIAEYEKLPPDARKHESGVRLADRFAQLQDRKKRLKDELALVDSEEADLEREILDYADKRGLLALAGTDCEVDLHEREEYRFPTRTANPQKIERIEADLKATPVWPEVSRLDPRALMDGFKKRRWPQEVMALIEGWMDKLIRLERVRSVRLKKRREADRE